ncbi:hypothetical protein WMY93_027759 [Mugilogobius chulae]|uniref:C-type lectin domain-containing protein n=1 Tax=Mugilogobius chulae TaxID=88201 RepID=A0AAW0MXB1_9GOBI
MLLSSLLCGVFVVTWAQEKARVFHFINVNLKWTDAQQFCRKHYTDLATVSSTEQMNRLPRPASYSGDAWIGLHNIAVTYDHWGYSVDTPPGCTGIYSWGEWFHYHCNAEQFFVCYDDSQGRKTFIPITLKLTWLDGRAYCRENHTDLALIESKEENDLVVQLLQAANSGNSWIGWDSRSAWRWSDGSWPDFTHWMTEDFLDVNSSICIVEDQNHYWSHESCDQTLPFFCYKGN